MKKTVLEAILDTACYYGEPMNEARLGVFAKSLADLPADEVVAAYESWIVSNVKFPLPASIRKMVQPEVDPDSAARDITAHIIVAVQKYGYTNPESARRFIGETGWKFVATRYLGWDYLCKHLGADVEIEIFSAQCRGQIKSMLLYSDECQNQIGQRIQSKLQLTTGEPTNCLTSAADILRNVIPPGGQQ